MPKISIIICTYNPKPGIFKKCIEYLEKATLFYKPSEILLIDNNSDHPIEEETYIKAFIQKFPYVRVIIENTQGLTPSRLRGIRESSGELLVFVDDDNFINEDYLSVAAGIYNHYPFIGAFSGQVSLEYDKEPPQWTRRYWGMLIHRELKEDLWSNQHFNTDTMPNGAGLCITRDTAEQYLKLFEEGKRNFILDRSKGSLMSGGDNDLAMCACDIGKGMALFKDLHLIHYIPASRFTLEYLKRLAYGIYFSSTMLQYMRTGKVVESTTVQKLKHLIRIALMNRNNRIIQLACKKGTKEAIKKIKTDSLV